MSVGQVFTVTVDIAQMDTPLSAFQFDLGYDPTIVAYVGNTRGDFLPATGRSVVCPTPARIGAATVRLACASTGASPGATGAGTLSVLTFRAVGSGESDLTLGNIQLPDTGQPPTLVGSIPQNGHVTVAQECIPVGEMSLSGPPEGTVGEAYIFTATVNPITGTATTPITYTWQATELTETVHSGGYLSDTVSFIWPVTGTKTVTVTADNGCSQKTKTTTIIIEAQRIYLPLILRNHASQSQRSNDAGMAFLLLGLGFPAAFVWVWQREKRERMSIPWRKIWSIITILGILGSSVPLTPVRAAPAAGNRAVPAPALEAIPAPALQAGAPPAIQRAPLRQAGGDWADLDNDHDVDGNDLYLMADHWNCATGDACYDAAYDHGGFANLIDAFDLASLGNQYDIEPPQLSITSPAAGAVVGGSVQVRGAVSDTHTISVTVNGTAATVASGAFAATISLASGNQAINVIATDELGAVSTASRLVGVDDEGPFIEVHTPKHRQ